MIEILSATVPIYLVVAVGFACTRGGLFTRDDMTTFSTFVVRIALPALIFVNLSGRRFEDIFNVTYLLVYAVAAWSMIAIGLLYGRLAGRPGMLRAFIAAGMSATNNGFVGFPIFLLLLPEVAGIAVGMDMLVDNTVLIPVLLALIENAAVGQVSCDGAWSKWDAGS